MMLETARKKAIFSFVLLAFFSAPPDFPLHAQSRAPRGAMAATPDSPPLGKSNTEKQILAVLDDLDRNQRSRLTVPAEDARLLRLLTESINAKHVVELGTANGYSGIWFALALQATGGKLTTFEIDPQRVKQARENFKRAGVDHMITLVEGDAHEGVTKLTGSIDLVFIDADKDGYVDYLNKLLPLVRPGGLVVAHNMRVPPPDPRYVNAITTNPDLETVFLNMHSAGVGVTLKKR
jgi:predicted O-methyltransferase YrrM